MFAQDRSTGVAATSLARSPWLRDLAVRRDRVPVDERADMPEVEESARVSFSDAVRGGAVAAVRDAAQRGEPVDTRLQRYREIARL